MFDINGDSYVTFVLIGLFLLHTSLCYFGIFTPLQYYFSLPLIQRGQLWRLITNLFFISPSVDIDFILRVLFFVHYSSQLESGKFRGKRADFVFMILIFMFFLNVAAAFTSSLMMSGAFVNCVVYIWSRHNAGGMMAIFGVITFRAPYLPLVMLLFSWLFGGSIQSDICGIFIGHTYYFLKFILPELTRKRVDLIQTPGIITFFIDHLPVIILNAVNRLQAWITNPADVNPDQHDGFDIDNQFDGIQFGNNNNNNNNNVQQENQINITHGLDAALASRRNVVRTTTTDNSTTTQVDINHDVLSQQQENQLDQQQNISQNTTSLNIDSTNDIINDIDNFNTIDQEDNYTKMESIQPQIQSWAQPEINNDYSTDSEIDEDDETTIQRRSIYFPKQDLY